MAETEVNPQPAMDAVAAGAAQAQAIADRIVQEQFHQIPGGASDQEGEEDASNKRKFDGGLDGADNGDGPVRKKVYSGPEENPGAVFTEPVPTNGSGLLSGDGSIAPGLDGGAQPVHQMSVPVPAPVTPTGGSSTPTASGLSDAVTCPAALVGRLIGKGGETIKYLQGQTGTKIQIDHQASGDLKKVSIQGPSSEAIERVKLMMKEVLDSEGPSSGPGDTFETVECPPGIVGRIIGRGGETIKGLQAASEAKIVVDQNFPQGVPRKVKISGKPEATQKAKKMVTDLINGEPGSAQVVIQKYGANRSLDCPKAMVGRVIGKGGETIKTLQKQTGATVQIEQTGDPCKVTISGLPQAVERAAAMVQDIISGGNPLHLSQYGDSGGPRGPRGSGFPPQFQSQYSPPPAGHYGGYSNYPPPAAQSHYGYGYGPGYAPPSYAPPQAQAPAPGPGSYGGYPGYGGQDPYASGGYGQGGYGQAGGAVPASGAQAGAQGGQGSQATAGSVWSELHDAEGRPYYYNTQTGASQWEKPSELQ
ncbi:hypothetical protein BSKO_11491 [Bryopsis sp. KO-2023]|nr:hypothetical protein BSKO_11491 [Bryopsis sp. KO-2023]